MMFLAISTIVVLAALLQGVVCEENGISYTFGGDGYMEFNEPEANLGTQIFEFDFKTFNDDGLFMHIGPAVTVRTDFFTLRLTDGGKINVVYSTGSTPGQGVTKESYNDGLWHNLYFFRHRQFGYLWIDKKQVLAVRAFSGYMAVDAGPLIQIGGRSDAAHIPKYAGCIRDLQMWRNDTFVKFPKDSLTLSDVTEGCAMSDPEIYSVSPLKGPVSGGTVVTLTGRDLDGDIDTIYSMGYTYPWEVLESNSTTIIARTLQFRLYYVSVPVLIRVHFKNGLNVTAPCRFTHMPDNYTEPQIDDVTPLYGPITGGTFLTIRGENLADIPGRVMLGEQIECEIVSRSATEILVKTPPVCAFNIGVPLPVQILSTDGCDRVSTGFDFTYLGNTCSCCSCGTGTCGKEEEKEGPIGIF